MGVADILMLKIQLWYEKKGVKFERKDKIIFTFWFYIFPQLATIPLLYWFLKFIFVDYMYKTYGFDKTIIFIAIIMMIKPLVMSVLEKSLKEYKTI